MPIKGRSRRAQGDSNVEGTFEFIGADRLKNR